MLALPSPPQIRNQTIDDYPVSSFADLERVPDRAGKEMDGIIQMLDVILNRSE